MTPPKVIHVVYRETLNQVIESQVLRPAAQLSNEFEMEIVALTPLGLFWRSPWRQKLASLKRRAKAQGGIRLRTPAGLPARLQRQALDDMLLTRSLRDAIDPCRPNVLHCRGAHATRCALAATRMLRNIKVIFDCRGDEPAEAVGRLGFDPDDHQAWDAETRAVWQAASELEQYASLQADGVVCVSEVLRRRLIRRHRADPAKIAVLPCSVDCDLFSPSYRSSARRGLGLKNRFVVGYVGSANWYQCIDESLKLFEAIRRQNHNAHFLGITPDLEKLHRALKEADIEESRFTLRSLPSSDVCRMIPAIDLGLLIRRDNSVNRVASPVKFGEYLASGVPVLLTPGLGDFSALVEAEELGRVIAFPEDCNAIDGDDLSAAAFDESMRLRCRSFAEERLSTGFLAGNFRSLYSGGPEASSQSGKRSMVPAA